MCGIAGVLDWRNKSTPDIVKQMIGAMAHRGPDAQAVVCRSPIALGHCRLAIIDLDPASNQPMHLPDAGLWVVFNGEIYNFRELRRELETAGIVFRTNGDTEVILHAFAKWGTGCFSRFNGMFALAIWDENNRRLIMARDRAGKKPLFYQPLPQGGVVFASELNALRKHPEASLQVNPKAIGQYLSLNYILGDQCILENVCKIPPANYVVLDSDKNFQSTEYWDYASCFRNKQVYKNEYEAAEILQELLDDAVRVRLVSDVPLGAFLSGGVDSGAVVAAMDSIQPHGQTMTFSVGFREKSYSELPEARSLANRFGFDHHEQTIDADMALILPLLVQVIDEPFADNSIIPSYYLSKYARKLATVCLSGDGGDELFAGYETYIADMMHSNLAWIPNSILEGMISIADFALPVSFNKISFDYKLRQFLSGLKLPYRRAHYSWRQIFSDAEQQTILRPDVMAELSGFDTFNSFDRHFDRVRDCHLIDQAMYVDAKTFMTDDILVKVDRSSMTNSLEVRSPILDYRIMEFAAGLPVEWKLKRLQKKYLFKCTVSSRLPKNVTNRKKSGFNSPLNHWLNSSMGDMAYEATVCSPMLEWFQREAIEDLWRQHRSRKRDNGFRLMGLTCMGLWLKKMASPTPPS